MPGSRPATIIDKLWDAHAIMTREDGQALQFIDRHILPDDRNVEVALGPLQFLRRVIAR